MLFTGASAVYFGVVLATNWAVVSETKITTAIPAGLGFGTVDVAVMTPLGTLTRANDKFTLEREPIMSGQRSNLGLARAAGAGRLQRLRIRRAGGVTSCAIPMLGDGVTERRSD